MHMNKKTLLVASILALQALVTATACKPKAPADSNVSSMAPDSGVRYVAPKDGLNMREEPSISGKKMLTIPKGAQVQKLEEKPESFKIDNIDGKWTKISWQGKTGWVFGGFLSTWAQASNSGSAAASTAPTSEDVTRCEERCEQERVSACIHINCGRQGVVCRPNEEEDCWQAANEAKTTCIRKCS
jgi:uncharacterized protein YgiM (DUF1202 family)